MKDEIKIEFGADFKRWLMLMAVLVTVLLVGLGAFVYHRIATSAAEEALKVHIREVGREGSPILVVAEDWFVNSKEGLAKKVSNHGMNPGLKLTTVMISGLDLKLADVVEAQERSLPPQIGTLNYDNETNFLIKCRFNGELVSFMKLKDKVKEEDAGRGGLGDYESESYETIERPVRFGDKVKQGDVLAVFWSVTLGTAKAAYVDAISAVRLSQDTYIRQKKLYDDGNLPWATVVAAERQLRGDNNSLLTAERSLRMWKMKDDEIKALRKEANEIIDALLLVPIGRIAKIEKDVIVKDQNGNAVKDKNGNPVLCTGMTLQLTKYDRSGTFYKLAKNCKFFQSVKKVENDEIKEDKVEIEGGLDSDIFQPLGATVVTNSKGEATEVVVGKGKERDFTGTISRIDDSGLTLLLAKDGKSSKSYKYARVCKFYQEVKKNGKDVKQEIKGGLKNDIFQPLGAAVVTDVRGEVKEVVVSKVKERDVVDEVDRWASTNVPVPWFDEAHPDRELTVVEKNTSFGDIVDNTNFGTWLFRVTDLTKLQIWVHPPEELLPIIREGLKTYYTITDEALVDLHGLPEGVLDKLRELKDQKFDKTQFAPELKDKLSEDEYKRYERTILKAVPLIREGKKAYYTITDEALRDLHGVPDQVVAKVAKLPRKDDNKKDKKFDPEEFVAALKNVAKLDADELDSYQRPILKQMRKKGELKWEIRLQSDPHAPPVSAPNCRPEDQGLLPIEMICPSLEPNQHNPMVVGYFPNKDHKFLVGQFVTATLKMPPEENTVEIPTAAINEYNGQSFIFVENQPGEYSIKRVAVVRRYAEKSIIRSKLRPQDEKFSADEVKEGRFPLRPLGPGERVVTHGVVELTSALESLLTKESIKSQK